MRRTYVDDHRLRTQAVGFVTLPLRLVLERQFVVARENRAAARLDGVPGVRYSAAVGLDSERAGTQRLHVVAEVRNDGASHDEYHGLVREIVSRLHKTQGHRPARVLLVRASTIPKTSSGKIQRSRLAQMIEGGQLHDRVVYGDH